MVDSSQRGGYVKHNRVMVFEDKRFEYDVHGRLETKRIGNHTEQIFSYDGEHRLRQVETTRLGLKQLIYFVYDALGRRIRKHDTFGFTSFLWDGQQMLQERRAGEVATYLYEPATFIPLARIDSRIDEPTSPASTVSHKVGDVAMNDNVYYFHNDASGLPEELTSASGEVS